MERLCGARRGWKLSEDWRAKPPACGVATRLAQRKGSRRAAWTATTRCATVATATRTATREPARALCALWPTAKSHTLTP
eukprot:2287467-Pleurochrysis_carterae.AAC.1